MGFLCSAGYMFSMFISPLLNNIADRLDERELVCISGFAISVACFLVQRIAQALSRTLVFPFLLVGICVCDVPIGLHHVIDKIETATRCRRARSIRARSIVGCGELGDSSTHIGRNSGLHKGRPNVTVFWQFFLWRDFYRRIGTNSITSRFRPGS